MTKKDILKKYINVVQDINQKVKKNVKSQQQIIQWQVAFNKALVLKSAPCFALFCLEHRFNSIRLS